MKAKEKLSYDFLMPERHHRLLQLFILAAVLGVSALGTWIYGSYYSSSPTDLVPATTESTRPVSNISYADRLNRLSATSAAPPTAPGLTDSERIAIMKGQIKK